MNKECFECGKQATEDHHVIPQSLGGTKTVPLCGSCHDRVHGWGNIRRDTHKELVKAGQQRAKERGVKIGFANEKYSGDIDRMRKKSAEVISENAVEFAKDVIIYVVHFKVLGYTLKDTALKLNELGIVTARNSKWYATSVSNIFDRMRIPRHHDTEFYEELQAELYENLTEEQRQKYLDTVSTAV